jgi:hypothetical protein
MAKKLHFANLKHIFMIYGEFIFVVKKSCSLVKISDVLYIVMNLMLDELFLNCSQLRIL